MISISKLWCGKRGYGDSLRYDRKVHRRPVVVWNCTKRCNLRCVHCYSASDNSTYAQELTTSQAEAFIKDLAEYDVPVLLFSGGEPLKRKDILQLSRTANELGIRTVLSTNGTLITKDMALDLKNSDFAYIGVSLDGIGETNDHFRGMNGAFEAAMHGIKNCISVGIKTGLRFTLTRHNFSDVSKIFNLVEREGIPRVCFYHLVYAGRAIDMVKEDLSHQDSRDFMDYVICKTEEFYNKDLDVEVLTVDNHSDASYLYLKLLEKSSGRAKEALQLLKRNGGNRSGEGISCVDSKGDVHADQFWRHYSFGNILKRRFSELWSDDSDPLLHRLRNRKEFLRGRCSRCKYLDICNGNFRVRAEAVYGDVWAPDPACYLTDDEIGFNGLV